MATSRGKKDNNVTFLSGAVHLSLFWYLWVGNTYRQVVFFFATYFEKQKKTKQKTEAVNIDWSDNPQKKNNKKFNENCKIFKWVLHFSSIDQFSTSSDLSGYLWCCEWILLCLM